MTIDRSLREPTMLYDIETEDVEYLRRDSTPLLARIIRPRGDGPFPAMVGVHGGAWIYSDRTHHTPIYEQLARLGIVAVVADFRMPPTASYPASLSDVNYAIRWVKAHGHQLGADPMRVGVMGDSSGGHQAVLTAMRPHDPRYCDIPRGSDLGAQDAAPQCAVALWPVISPSGRYRYARRLLAAGERQSFTDLVLPGHEQYWLDEQAMEEGDPVLALARGESAGLVPVLAVQGLNDRGHPLDQLRRFVDLYRQAGGRAELELVELPAGVPLGKLMDEHPDDPVSVKVLTRIAEFIQTSTMP